MNATIELERILSIVMINSCIHVAVATTQKIACVYRSRAHHYGTCLGLTKAPS